jgi:hypothetical protein
MPGLLTATEVADMLRLSRRAFLARRRGLEALHGFPAPLAGLPDRWAPAAIDAWIARQGGAPIATPETGEATLIDRARRLAG